MDKKEIIALAERFLKGTATEEEKLLLHKWYDAWQDDEEMISTTEANTEDNTKERILSRLHQSMQSSAPFIPHRNNNVKKYWLAAASILFIAALAGYFLSVVTRQKVAAAEVKAVKQDAAPGGNKAILTLADGSKIVLDTVINGSIAQQGSSRIVKQKDGELVYNAGTAPASAEIMYNTISTPRGGQYQLVLPDGSKVWLNAASSLRYPTAFTGSDRKVELSGEAYFEIVSIAGQNNKKQPFIVAVKDMAVKVLGTDFNINAYDDEKDIKTTLLKGSVDVTGKQNTAALRLIPGQQSVYNDNGKIALIKDADTEQAVAWKNGLFRFNSTSLAAIMRQVSRWYDVDISYQGNVKEETFSGDMPRKQNASEVFKVLEMTKTVQFSIENKNVIIEPYNK